MSKQNKKDRRFKNPDFRRRVNVPAPEADEIRSRLISILTPGMFSPLRLLSQRERLRERVLTLPTMTALMLSIIWRQIGSLGEALRLATEEGMLWAQPERISKQALSKRLQKMPAWLFAELYERVIEKISQESGPEEREGFSCIRIADGSTLEQLRRTTRESKEGTEEKLGGKMMMTVDAATHRPVQAFYREESESNDKMFCDKLIESVLEGGLLIFDLGFFSFPFFDAFTDSKKYFVTRMREKTAYKTIEVLGEGARYRDEIIKMGLYRSNPCQHPVRMVSVLWNGTWYRYLTNFVDPKKLSARRIVELYRSRWRIEQAFMITKRLLGLAYLWVGHTNGVQIQIYCTWIFYAVLMTLCAQVAEVLKKPLEKISVEMVFRGLYHYSKASERGDATDVISYYVKKHEILSLVKEDRKRNKIIDLQSIEVWGAA
jgi:hypothetical protein